MTETRHAEAAIQVDLMQRIVAAYLSNNAIQATELPVLIRSVCVTLRGLAGGGPEQEEPEKTVEKPKPAQIRKSITPDGLVSFIDGKPYKTLKRHLTKHGLAPDTYRERFGLPADYPMVAPSYAANRSALAISHGLGTRQRQAPVPPAPHRTQANAAARPSAM